jgi:hypothetical protein
LSNHELSLTNRLHKAIQKALFGNQLGPFVWYVY